MTRLAPWWLVFAGTVLVAGCDFSDMNTPAVTAECRKIGEHCQLADGPLGVCLQRPCKPDETPPCFACTPQH